ncbi:MAG: hypothetical protein KTR32_12535 [Granulosicoccus sp.]|nr:hypothetical protein [Granulosicoccus sp.]
MHKTTFFVCFATPLALGLAGCGWVDSAGNGDSGVLSDSSQPVPMVDVSQDGVPGQEINAGGSLFVLNEQANARVTTSVSTQFPGELTFDWTSDPIEQGILGACTEINGFSGKAVATSLSAACTNPDECRVEFARDTQVTDDAAFDIQIPVLKAPVGLRYQLTVTDESGNQASNDFYFCLVAINESPVAEDDEFVVVDGEELSVSADDAVHLLSNDSDDVDNSNKPLRVLTEPVTRPQHALSLTLDPDGGFTYAAAYGALQEEREDQFTYQVTDDATTPARATVRIRVLPGNLPPTQLREIPPLTATEGVPFQVDFAPYFSDPESTRLQFTFSENSVVPPSGEFVLTTAGVFSGTAVAADVGSYQITLIVSDGSLTARSIVSLDIAAAPLIPANAEPVFVPTAILNRNVVLGDAIVAIEPEFTDPDGDPLTYTMFGNSALPIGVRLNRFTGRIAGTPQFRGLVNNLRVQATDPSGATAVSTAFFIRTR